MRVSKEYADDQGWPYSAREVEIIDQTRWSTIRRGIVTVDGCYYWITWSEGSTELQDEEPWQFEEEVELTRIRQVERTMLVWEKVPE